MARTARRQLEGRRLLFGECLRSWTTLNVHFRRWTKGRCPLLLLRTFSAHAKVVSRDEKEMRNTQDMRTGFVSFKSGRFYLFFCGKNASFFNRWKLIFLYLVSSLKTEEVCACCYFCRMIDVSEHFIVKQKSILKHQKLLLQDVTLGAWVVKKSLNRQGSVNQKENSSNSSAFYIGQSATNTFPNVSLIL